MTLGEGKRKVLMLLDEYSSGGEIMIDEDIAAKMNDFFDIAQKDVAGWQPIVRRTDVELDGTGSQELPADVARVLSVKKDGKRLRGFEVIDGTLIYPAGDESTVVIDYIATPATVTQETEDSYEFEVSEEAANCMPFFVAAQQLVADLVVDYGAFYSLYLQMRGAIQRTVSFSDGGMRQALFRR